MKTTEQIQIDGKAKPSSAANVSPDEMLSKELGKVIRAGDKLAEAAHYVQSNYDGIHRLRLALAKWYQVRADENGRD